MFQLNFLKKLIKYIESNIYIYSLTNIKLLNYFLSKPYPIFLTYWIILGFLIYCQLINYFIFFKITFIAFLIFSSLTFIR